MAEIMGDPDCEWCKGEGCVRTSDDDGEIYWTGCICINQRPETDPFIDDLIDSAGALK
jgi:hypothetical protein